MSIIMKMVFNESSINLVVEVLKDPLLTTNICLDQLLNLKVSRLSLVKLITPITTTNFKVMIFCGRMMEVRFMCNVLITYMSFL
jgi:hypothetical protein